VGPSKSELKKRAKAAEKEKKAAEKAAKQQELAQQKADAEIVSLANTIDLDLFHSQILSRISPRIFTAIFHSINPKIVPVDRGIK
jgi:hypothetical protein